MRGGGGERATVGSRLMEERSSSERIKQLLEPLEASRDASVRDDARKYLEKVESYRVAIGEHIRKLIQVRNAPGSSHLELYRKKMMIQAANMKLAEWITIRRETQMFIKSVHASLRQR